jgi:hypothetical protein
MSANAVSPEPPGSLERGRRLTAPVWASLTALALLAGAAWALFTSSAPPSPRASAR